MIPVLDGEVDAINELAVKLANATGDVDTRHVAGRTLVVLQLGQIATRLTVIAIALVAIAIALVLR